MPSDEMLTKYADVALLVGLGLKEGDRLLIEAPLLLPDFTRRLVERAYEAGAVNVDVLWLDDAIERARFANGSAAAAETVAESSRFKALAFADGASYLRILAEDPASLAGTDVSRVKEFRRINNAVIMPAREGQMTLRDKWCVIAAPVPAWAKTVFDDTEDVATEKLWSAIFRACRVDLDDPIAAWQEHGAQLAARRDYLTSRHFVQLRYEGPGTDLVLGLPDNVIWQGGPTTSTAGDVFFPNVPTEEVFAVPHRHKGEGTITATKPLSYFGNLIEGFAFEIAEGRVVNATADKGQDVLDQILQTDEGSVYFGETAMVPQSSAVSAEALVWNNMLFDENDGCHIAIGMSYPTCVDGATEMSPDERLAIGLNQSSVHVDFVVGSPQLNVHGIRADGSSEPILANGEWGFDL